jgi:pimeloyl-ACP methyl ester carboxylesterase
VGRAMWLRETQVLDEAARLTAEGKYVRLSRGYTHYEIGALPAAPPVVLIHGFSVPYFIWDPTFRAVAEGGMNPVRYDLYGRGYSDRPQVKYNIDLFVAQLHELLDSLDLETVALVALSMGGPIACAFTLAFPLRVRRLVLIDPSGAEALSLSTLYRLVALPGISDLIFGLLGTEYMLRSVAADFYDPVLVEQFREQYRVQMRFRGFKRAILSTVRQGMLGDFSDNYRQLEGLDMPVLLIWGRNDRTVPFEQSLFLRQLMPKAGFLPIPDCGHIPHYERPDLVNPKLLGFLQESHAPG